ncbi:MAG TPA: hypothetical protein VLR49_11645 [Ferruginibacter sp.]|nr:hypothetical protein [Ferruginibacter sp.]
MLRLLLLISCFSLGEISMAQPKPKTVVKNTIPGLNGLLTTSGLPYKMVNDSLAVIPYEGNNIKSFQLVVRQISDMYIVLSNLTEAMPGKIGESNYKYLLHQNNNFDVVKIGISEEDNTVTVRADLYKTGTNAASLKRVIAQVATVTDIIGGDLNKPNK